MPRGDSCNHQIVVPGPFREDALDLVDASVSRLHVHPRGTDFMRDPALFVYIRDEMIPRLISAARKQGNDLRVWAASCGTGEEAYSLAILIHEALGNALEHFTVRIFATDLDGDAIESARRGLYPATMLGDVPPEILERYFTEIDGSLLVNKSIRSLMVFGVHDLSQQAPYPRIEMILCHDVLERLPRERQARALQLFAYSTMNAGFLVLGRDAPVSPPEDYFCPVEPALGIYQRHGEPASIAALRLTLARPAQAPVAAEQCSPRSRADDGLAAALPVGVVRLEPRFDILEINRAARDTLGIHGPAIGEDLVHLIPGAEGRRLRAALDAALRGFPDGVLAADQGRQAQGLRGHRPAGP